MWSGGQHIFSDGARCARAVGYHATVPGRDAEQRGAPSPAANSAEGVVVESDPGERSMPLPAASSGACRAPGAGTKGHVWRYLTGPCC